MRNLFALAAIVLGGNVLGAVVTNLGTDHQGILDHSVIYSQVGKALNFHTCKVGQAPSLKDCKITQTIQASEFHDFVIALASINFSGKDSAPAEPTELLAKYEALFGDSKMHNFRFANENALEDQTENQDFAGFVALTPVVFMMAAESKK